MTLEDDVYAAIDRWDEERFEAGIYGSMGRLLFYVQQAFQRHEES